MVAEKNSRSVSRRRESRRKRSLVGRGLVNRVVFGRALVTGAGGCIGRCLVARLVAEGCKVNALDLDAGGLQKLVGTLRGTIHFLWAGWFDLELS